MILSWVFYAIVVASCGACLAAAADTLLQAARRPARWVWAAAFGAAILIPTLAAVRPRPVLAPLPSAGTLATPVPALASLETDGPMDDPWVGGVWASASALMLLVLVGGLAQLSRARRRARRETLAGCEVAVTPDLGPGVVPFGRPRILVPRWAAELPAEAVRLLVAHEGEHVRAGDARLVLGAALVVAAMPWNPALWWCLRRLRTAIELDCDARVLRRESSVAPYAELLLHVAARCRTRALPALLTFADSTSQLQTRIDAMTVMRVLTPMRRAALGALAVVALFVACEARRPQPLAPVTDFVMTDGQATALTFDRQQAEQDDRTRPMLMVHDAKGTVVYAGRVDGPDGALKSLPPGDIQTIEVMKRADLLPDDAKAGLVRVVLKPGATWPTAAADSAAGIRYKTPASFSGEAPAGTAVPDVVLHDGNGKVLYEGASSTGRILEEVGPYRLSEDQVARLEVRKAGPSGAPDVVRIWLKSGVVPARR